MLAQNFMTPIALDISDAEFEALVKVLGMLERGEIKAELFDMERFGNPSCGTAGCILGWVWTLDKEAFLRSTVWLAVGRLFWPRHGVSPAQAAIALRNYLTHGEPRWAEAMAD